MPFLPPNQQRQSTEDSWDKLIHIGQRHNAILWAADSAGSEHYTSSDNYGLGLILLQLNSRHYLKKTKSPRQAGIAGTPVKKVKVAHTRLPSRGFWSWSRFLAVSLQVTWVINPAVGCHYFPPGLQLPAQPLRGLLPILLLGEQRHNGCEQFA